jgi:uncharacterized membrane protein YsdA (DUF1294 family)
MRSDRTTAFLVSSIFLGGVYASTLFTGLPRSLLYAYLALSVFTYLVYAKDKSAAMNDRWRTPEATLHLLALIGGWPGALVAQQTLRHKSVKNSFRIIFWLTAVFNCAALVWVHTADGRVLLMTALLRIQEIAS